MRASLIDRDGLMVCIGSRPMTRATTVLPIPESDREEAPQPLGFENVLLLLADLHLRSSTCARRLQIFIVNADQREVAIPDAANSVQGAVNQLFDGRKNVQNPTAHETGINSLVRLERNQQRNGRAERQRGNPQRPFGSISSTTRSVNRDLSQKLEIAQASFPCRAPHRTTDFQPASPAVRFLPESACRDS